MDTSSNEIGVTLLPVGVQGESVGQSVCGFPLGKRSFPTSADPRRLAAQLIVAGQVGGRS